MGSSDTVEPFPRAEESIAVLELAHMHACTPTPPVLPALFHTTEIQRNMLTLAGNITKSTCKREREKNPNPTALHTLTHVLHYQAEARLTSD